MQDFIKVKMSMKVKKIYLNLLEKINFYRCCELINTEYAEKKNRSQLSTVVLKISAQ